MSEKLEVILVDIGNSSVKTTEVSQGIFREEMVWGSFQEVAKKYGKVPMMISSVRKIDANQLRDLDAKVLTYQTLMPITLDYETPETLGADRIAAAAGANEMFPDQDNLIVDMGTCMTIDLIDRSGTFRGGIISPGLKMRMKSMSHFTDQLPDISNEWKKINSVELGKSTKECLLSGSYWGMIHEINGVMSAMSRNFTSLNTIITGGDAHFFESKLKAHIFAGSKIVQKGLYRIWKYQ
ncbi:MAG: type III pantothenate kinase [Ekhidna sp.]|uniref:type III pantothenate kinase n=1 Tax=Ekhidna sp. TaxID=2608089 RepID=UPI0032EE3EE4